MDPKKTTLAELIDAFVASDRPTPLTSSAIARLMYWRRTLGAHPVATLTADEADAAVGALIARGRVRPMSRGRSVAIGKPLSPTTVDRYCNDLDGLYRYARRLRIVPRTHLSPLAGRERAPQPVDAERYFRETDVEKLIAMKALAAERQELLEPVFRATDEEAKAKGEQLGRRDLALQTRKRLERLKLDDPPRGDFTERRARNYRKSPNKK